MNLPIPTDTLARAATYRAAGKNWDWIAARVGVGVDRLRRRIDPGYQEKRLLQVRAAKSDCVERTYRTGIWCPQGAVGPCGAAGSPGRSPLG